ncbi:MAG: hypothetical protein HC901_02520 [Bdellovibrionaceae bacterium]|nr:hypothetical protein [Pseudobdellovibrionaceae bacterium]
MTRDLQRGGYRKEHRLDVADSYTVTAMDDSAVHPRRPPRMMLLHGVRPFYFLTFNTSKRVNILDNKGVHDEFVDYCKRGWDEHRVAVGRYVLMPDHIHVFVVLPQAGPPICRWVQGLKSVLGKQLLEQGCKKPHWQEGFFDHVLRGVKIMETSGIM